jgi:amino acid transporter
MSAKLKSDSLSFVETIIMGIAGSAPAFSIAVAIAGLLGAAGTVSPNALLLFALPMLGIAVAYKGLSKEMPHAGAAYQWTKQGFGQFFGYFSGWALLIAALVFMVTSAVPLGTATIDLFDPSLADNVWLTTGIGAAWFVLIGVILISGIELTARVQTVMSVVEIGLLLTIAIAAYLHSGKEGLPFSWSWFSFNYPAGTFATSALLVVFLYWGWDVTANLGEETQNSKYNSAGSGGFYSVFFTIASFVAFTVATLMLFSLNTATGFSDNLIYHVAIAAGLGKFGGYAASVTLILSSMATMETTMLQFSRTLFAMGRDKAMPAFFGKVDARTMTPVRTMYLLLGLGLVTIFASSFMPSVSQILTDSVNAIAVQVCYYYGLAGLVCAKLYAKTAKRAPLTFLFYSVYPLLSALALFVLGVYAFSTFSMMTKIIGVGGLLAGILFYRPSGYGTHLGDILAEE